jgi:hypothetical protein
MNEFVEFAIFILVILGNVLWIIMMRVNISKGHKIRWWAPELKQVFIFKDIINSASPAKQKKLYQVILYAFYVCIFLIITCIFFVF